MRPAPQGREAEPERVQDSLLRGLLVLFLLKDFGGLREVSTMRLAQIGSSANKAGVLSVVPIGSRRIRMIRQEED